MFFKSRANLGEKRSESERGLLFNGFDKRKLG
jgi:hypothetical protein